VLLYFEILASLVGAAFLVWFVLVVLFAPGIPYSVQPPVDASTAHFITTLEAACQTTLRAGNSIEVFSNGPNFYPAMLDAIRGAQESINLECYIFSKGEAAKLFIAALSERARAGVRVSIVMDTYGSLRAYLGSLKELKAAGCRVCHYRHVTWYGLARLNNRTHRELLIVDGRVAFVGGAGIADWWLKPYKGRPVWRDMMARIEGPIVPDIQGIFAENWLECCGEIFAGEDTYKPRTVAGSIDALAIRSSPSDRSTVSRILFQTIIEGARKSVRISTPYFLPDRAFRKALIKKAKSGVPVSVVVPGKHTDLKYLRLASRRGYGSMLANGVKIFEYQPGMTHVKALIVDGLWAVIGSTNLDNRSFEHNDEDNVAARDPGIAARLTEDFESDLAESRAMTLAEWRRRPIWEKAVGSIAWLLERQQ
jgi:cardiolipin synthase